MYASGSLKGQMRAIVLLTGLLCQDSKSHVEIKGPKSATQLAARLLVLCFVTQGEMFCGFLDREILRKFSRESSREFSREFLRELLRELLREFSRECLREILSDQNI